MPLILAAWAFSYIMNHFLKKILSSKEETPCCPVCAAPITPRPNETPSSSSYKDRVYDINKRGKAGNLIVEQVLDRGIWKPKVSPELKKRMRAGAEMGLKEGRERMQSAREFGVQKVATWKEKRSGQGAVEEGVDVESVPL
ncbi:hypothetical protein BDV96DRAFT_575519 [Lophiotrema nucula]|uniref:Uncharacterized protein n=1 Tax=Lophiotrema nucula TaxID=690887 RepID=A0A6A5Z8P9_9PLEO|nr:hypothetical protein BDV96DRAFT_575519 [Lophiotrema nucula]